MSTIPPLVADAHPWRGIVELLACPATLQPLREVEAELLRKLNDAIGQGRAIKVNGKPQTKVLQAALVREDGQVFYAIEDGILDLLEGEGIQWKP